MVVPGPSPEPEGAPPGSLERAGRRARFAGEWLEAEVLRGEPETGLEATGPSVFELPEATMVLPPGWRARVDGHGTIVAERVV
jgi:N-methylhydantoinase A/oxoprolinase/acetone carboxylase beta subunit